MMDEKYIKIIAQMKWKNEKEMDELKKLIEIVSAKIIDISGNKDTKETIDDIKRLVKNFTIIFLLTHKLATDEFEKL